MLPLLSSLKGLTKQQAFTADNHIFRLHYRFTVGILVLFSLITTYNQFFGDPISCTNTGSKVAENSVVDPFCWADSTYSARDAFDKPVGGEFGVPYPGLGKPKTETDIYKHKYYQWVCFMLALQAVLFYVPRYVWKAMEGERVKNLVLGLNLPTLVPEEVKRKQDLLVRYIKSHRGLHQKYVWSYTFCEFLNLLNVVGQMFLLDTFLGGEFMSFGVRVIEHTYLGNTDKTDPMTKLFPRLTKCLFIHQGPGGGNTEHFVFCVLPLNIINEKIFIFLWFWFVILLGLTSIGLIYRVVIFQLTSMRIALLKARSPVSDEEDIQKVTRGIQLGDWFILYQLAKNIDPLHMADILNHLADELDCVKKSWVPKRSERTSFDNVKEDLV